MKPGLNILLTEDEAIIAMDLEWRLKQAGAGRCRIVATGESALAWFEKEPPDVVVLDNHLAGVMDGIEAAARIRAEGSGVPIIFMSGYPQDEAFLARVRPLHPLACLDKP
ncbi:MAG: response regulator, partial [Candidatus Aminicenantes bacterium]|nr:response regulator [Candidatus Aminicenantes bacterium]